MNTLRQMKGGVLAAVAALVIIAIAFFAVGRLTSPTANATPHIIAAWAAPTVYDTCVQSSCFSVTFHADGPFTIVVDATAFDVNVDSPQILGGSASYTLALYNGSGHLVDQVTQGPFDPNQDKVGADVIPEAVAARTYQIPVTPLPYAINVDIVVLSASQ